MAEPFDFTPPDLSVPQAVPTTPSVPSFSFNPPDLSTPSTTAFNFQAPDLTGAVAPQTFPSTFKKEKTVGGFAKNFIDDATETLKGLGHFLVVDLPQAIAINPARAAIGGALDIDADKQWREKYTKDWSERIKKFIENPAELPTTLGKALIDPYTTKDREGSINGFNWDVWYERPFTILADAAAIASLGAGTAGKAANVAGRTTAMGERLVKVADTLGKADKVLNPLNWVATGGKKLATPVMDSLGIGKYSPGLTKIVQETRSEAAAERTALGKAGVTAEERTLMTGMEEIRPVPGGIKTEGIPRLLIDEVPGQPNLLKYRTPERGLEEVRAVPIIGPNTPEEAADLLAQAKEKIRRREQIKGNIDAIETGRIPTNPEISARIADTFTDLKWRKIAFDRINQFLVDNKVISQVELPGFVEVNLHGLNKVYDTTLSTLNAFDEARKAALAAGQSPGEAFQAGGRAAKAWAESVKNVDLGKGVWVPKHVAQYLKHEFMPPDLNALTSMYKYWTPAVTALRFPSYHLQVLVGNTLMSLLYGVNPITEWAMTKRLRNKKAFPAELQEVKFIEDWANGEGAFNKVGEAYQKLVDKVGDIGGVQGSDHRLRQEIAVHYLSKELKKGVLGSVPTHEALEAAIAEILGSKQALRDVIDEVKKAQTLENEAQRLADAAAGNVRPALFQPRARPPRMPGPPGTRQPLSPLQEFTPEGAEAMRKFYAGEPHLGGELIEDITPQAPRKTPGPRTTQKPELLGGKRMPEGAATPNEGIRRPVELQGVEEAFNQANYLATKRSAREAAEFLVPDLQKKVDLLNKAIEEGNRWAGNVMSLHPVERSILKKIVPFYTYTKAMTALAFSAAVLYPKRMFMLNRLAALTADIMHDKDAPEWVQDYVPFGFDSAGNIMAMRLGSLNPFSGVRGEEFGDLPIPGLIDPTRNPIVKLVYEAAGGTPHWTKKPMSPGEYAVRYGDGSVYEYQKDGTFKKTIPQPKLLKTALYQFPQIQALMELGDAYVVNDRGNPILGPDGKPRFPKELWTRLLNFGVAGTPLTVKTASYKEKDLKDQMQRKAGSIMNEFRKELRNPSLTPEEHQTYIDILRDAAQAEHRRIENQ